MNSTRLMRRNLLKSAILRSCRELQVLRKGLHSIQIICTLHLSVRNISANMLLIFEIFNFKKFVQIDEKEGKWHKICLCSFLYLKERKMYFFSMIRETYMSLCAQLPLFFTFLNKNFKIKYCKDEQRIYRDFSCTKKRHIYYLYVMQNWKYLGYTVFKKKGTL